MNSDLESRQPPAASACERVQSSLPLWVGGELAASEAAFVGAHVEACEACRARARSAELARAAFREDGLALAKLAEADARSLWPELRRQLLSEALITDRSGVGVPAPAPLAGAGATATGTDVRRRRPAPRLSFALRGAALAAAAGLIAYVALPSDPSAPASPGATHSDAPVRDSAGSPPIAATMPARSPSASGTAAHVQPVSLIAGGQGRSAMSVPPEVSALGYSALGWEEIVPECPEEGDPIVNALSGYGPDGSGLRRLRVGEPTLAELALQGALLDHALGPVILKGHPSGGEMIPATHARGRTAARD